MGYGIWGRSRQPQQRGVGEKAYRRSGLAAWDVRWHGLSDQARFFFLDQVKGPTKQQTSYAHQPSVPAERFPPRILKELTAAGFVKVETRKPSKDPDRVVAVEELLDFAARLRSLKRHHLLAADRPIDLQKYVNATYYTGELLGVFANVLRQANIVDFYQVEDVLSRYVVTHRWPAWVAQSLNDPLAGQLLEVIQTADQPLPIVELSAQFPDIAAEKVRSTLDQLILRLALFEDLAPQSHDLVVGLLPAVREDLERVRIPRQRPPLMVCKTPKEVGPESSPIIDDLRAFLLEVASEPPRLRQDKSLFQKEIVRFQQTLGPLPTWLLAFLKWSDESRLNQAHNWARFLKLVQESVDGKQILLRLSPKGNDWLTSSLADQYALIFETLQASTSRHDIYNTETHFLYSGIDFLSYSGSGDARFLGVNVLALRMLKGKPPPSPYLETKPEDHQPLREAIHRAFAALPQGDFHRLDRVLEHLVFGPHNPLLLGLDQEQVAVFCSRRPVPPLEEQREEAGRLLLDALLRRRLIPLGCVRAAIDAEGQLNIARTPRLDAYFGQEVPDTELAGVSASETRVIVQPDFSIVVIGLNPAPVAELAPFCERPTRGGGAGAMVLKLTRASVVKAVAHGLKPEEIVKRLQAHSSKEVPVNVLQEVREWCRWVRSVQAKKLMVLQCPDSETADRVVGALRRQVQRLNETLVAIDQEKLSAADRNKLRDQGILVQEEPNIISHLPKKRTKRRW